MIPTTARLNSHSFGTEPCCDKVGISGGNPAFYQGMSVGNGPSGVVTQSVNLADGSVTIGFKICLGEV